MSDRILELEIKVAYLEDTINTLDEVIINQQNTVDKLDQTCQYLLEQYGKVSDILEKNDSNTIEKPPHY